LIPTSAAPAAEPTVAVQAVDPLEPAEPTPPQVVATSVATPQGAGEKNMEERLQRLERLVESMVSMHNPSAPSTTQYMSRRAPLGDQVTAYGRAMRQASPSLTDLKKQRIDIEDELARLQERLKNIDDQIERLQSVRSRNLPEKK
jgi:chromosome segregation ATPase